MPRRTSYTKEDRWRMPTPRVSTPPSIEAPLPPNPLTQLVRPGLAPLYIPFCFLWVFHLFSSVRFFFGLVWLRLVEVFRRHFWLHAHICT